LVIKKVAFAIFAWVYKLSVNLVSQRYSEMLE